MRKFYFFVLITTCLFAEKAMAQEKTDALLQTILQSSKQPVIQEVIRQPDKYRCQIIYTQINRNKHNQPSFKNYYFNYNPALYYNPASMVKMPLAFLSLEKLNQFNKKEVNKYTDVLIDSSYPGQVAMYHDSTSANGFPSIAHFIKRAFLISENDPYNRMYQFMGQEAINRSLHQKGYSGIRITRQFMGYSEEQNKHTNPFRFIGPDGNVLHAQPGAYNRQPFNFGEEIKIGKAYLNRNDSLINEPFDFTKHNNVPLEDFQQMLQAVLFPESVPAQQRFDLSKDDRNFLLRYLSQYPSETDYPKYDTSLFYDSYVKNFFNDGSRKIPAHIRVFNKVGWAYGFLTDVSYVIDVKNNIEYMLSATVYVNEDGVLNDSKYDYETTGQPFMNKMGQTIYNYELTRKRTSRPKLDGFNIQYNKRKKSDNRPSIKVVDN